MGEKKVEKKERKFFYGHFLQNLKHIGKLINVLDFDYFIVVAGRERIGKTTLAVQICSLIDKSFKEQSSNLPRICFDIEEYLRALKNAQRGQAVILDEAGAMLLSRESMNTLNRTIIKTMMITGLKNVLVVLCIPSFFLLDTYVREHRVNNLMLVYERGKLKAYSPKKTRIISIKGREFKNYNVTPPTFKERFIKAWPSDEFRKNYDIKKRSYVNKFLKEVKDTMAGYYKLGKFAELTGYNIKTLRRWVSEDKLKCKRIGGRIFIPKTELDRVMELLEK